MFRSPESGPSMVRSVRTECSVDQSSDKTPDLCWLILEPQRKSAKSRRNRRVNGDNRLPRPGTDVRVSLSFLSTLKALGITSRANLEKIRKATAKRAFEAHDLLLRSYYAAKSSPSPTRTDFSGILGNAFAFQQCAQSCLHCIVHRSQ